MNEEHLVRLVSVMYKVDDCPELDEYGSRIFGRPIQYSWRIFRHIARTATPNVWVWRFDSEMASYPKDVIVPTFEDFATVMLHEVAHGWCYFYKDNLGSYRYRTGEDEERVCWEVSRMVCRRLYINYQDKLAELGYLFHLRSLANDVEGLKKLEERAPAHMRF